MPGRPEAQGGAEEVVLFDFETLADLAAWSNLNLSDAKQKEPAAKIALSKGSMPPRASTA